MHLLAGFAAVALLLVVLVPVVRSLVREARRKRSSHGGGACHWYANFDEELRYEPHVAEDIVRRNRSEIVAKGYAPTADVQRVPRTFRRRIPGDTAIRLWRSPRPGNTPIWLCEWAMVSPLLGEVFAATEPETLAGPANSTRDSRAPGEVPADLGTWLDISERVVAGQIEESTRVRDPELAAAPIAAPSSEPVADPSKTRHRRKRRRHRPRGTE